MTDHAPSQLRLRKRKRLRRVRTVMLCLVVGALINVLVAWVCALRSGVDSYLYRHDISEATWKWLDELGISFKARPIWHSEEYYGFGTMRIEYRGSPGGINLGIRNPDVIRYEAGWPFRSMSVTDVNHEGRGIRVGYQRVVSLVPLWPIPDGFILNSFFFSPLCALMLLPGFIRKRWRLGRNLCPACAYDLRGAKHEVCPECGEPT